LTFRGFLGRKKELAKYVKFYPFNDVPNPEIFGYDLQKKSAVAIALAATEISEACFVLFFGIPGTGKSEFPYYTAHGLEKEFRVKYSMMYAQCDELLGEITSGRAKPDEVIEEIEGKVRLAYENRPAMLVLDEIDSFSTSISGSEMYAATLTRWIRKCAKEAPDKTLIVGTTNWPRTVDFSVWRRILVSLFFDVTPSDVICSIINKKLGLQKSLEIGENLCAAFEQARFVPMASDAVKGCNQFLKNCSEPEKMSFDDICKDLKALTSGSPKVFVDDYWKNHEDFINRAQDQMQYWEKQFSRRKSLEKQKEGDK
jgi:hypothetical protein